MGPWNYPSAQSILIRYDAVLRMWSMLSCRWSTVKWWRHSSFVNYHDNGLLARNYDILHCCCWWIRSITIKKVRSRGKRKRHWQTNDSQWSYSEWKNVFCFSYQFVFWLWYGFTLSGHGHHTRKIRCIHEQHKEKESTPPDLVALVMSALSVSIYVRLYIT